ncbi:MAG: hypothetical protein JXR48_11150, partial [Candidatus Delongbacteria bacterium]|nr:hypothetical protein [Candidatus Delongbacteria bacterium]
MKRLLLILITLVLITAPLAAENITIAPFLFYGPSDEADTNILVSKNNTFVTVLKEIFRWDNLIFNPLAIELKPPASFLEAMEICTENKIDYLVYGFIEYRDFYYHGEIKLFNRERREVIKTFYASDDEDHLERLISELAEKFGDYLNSIFDLKLVKPKPEPREGIISFMIASGYWVYLSPQWSGIMAPLYSVDIHTYFTPSRPGETAEISDIYFTTGLTLNFTHAINRPDFESTHLLDFAIGIPLMASIDIGVRHTISASLTPEMCIDYLIREARYNDTISRPDILFST